MGIDHIKALGDESRRVFDVDNVIALARKVTVGQKQAMLEGFVIVHFANSHTVVIVVCLGIVVAENNRPRNTQALHKALEHTMCDGIVDGSADIRNGKGNVTRNNDKIGLFCLDHCRNGVDGHFIFIPRKESATKMYVGELHYAEFAVGGEIIFAIFKRGCKRIIQHNGRKGIDVFVHLLFAYLVNNCESAENKC